MTDKEIDKRIEKLKKSIAADKADNSWHFIGAPPYIIGADFLDELFKRLEGVKSENAALNTKMNEIQDIINYAQGEIEQSIQYEAQIKFLKKDCYNLKAETAALREKLAAANKRADAAVKDMKICAEDIYCSVCKMKCSGVTCKGFEWRGEQEGEKG